MGHTERCPLCKQKVGSLLRRIYGGVDEGKGFDVPAQLDAVLARCDTPVLRTIHETLASLRGHTDFARSRRLPQCDYHVPNPDFGAADRSRGRLHGNCSVNRVL